MSPQKCQEIVRRSFENGNGVHFEKFLILHRFNPFGILEQFELSGSSEMAEFRLFYFKWAHCTHSRKVVVVDPPLLCHIHTQRFFTNGHVVADVCPDCTEGILATCDELKPKQHQSKMLVYHRVTDLSQLPDDLNVFVSPEGEMFLNVATRLSKNIMETLEPVFVNSDTISLSIGKVSKNKSMSVKELKSLRQNGNDSVVVEPSTREDGSSPTSNSSGSGQHLGTGHHSSSGESSDEGGHNGTPNESPRGAKRRLDFDEGSGEETPRTSRRFDGCPSWNGSPRPEETTG